MFEVNRPKRKPNTIIRPASGRELSNYEKHLLSKLESIAPGAQENKIEVLSVNINGVQQPVNINDKEARIDLGELSQKNEITSEDISNDDLFRIICELD